MIITGVHSEVTAVAVHAAPGLGGEGIASGSERSAQAAPPLRLRLRGPASRSISLSFRFASTSDIPSTISSVAVAAHHLVLAACLSSAIEVAPVTSTVPSARPSRAHSVTAWRTSARCS